MTDVPEPDLTNLPRFFDHLAPRDSEAAQLARHLLAAGWGVRVFWGPEQMDVWQLTVQRGEWFVRFGVERGRSDGVLVGRSDATVPGWNESTSLGYAIFAWARAHEVPFPLDHPGDVRHAIAEYGPAALDWLAEGNASALERVSSIAYDFARSAHVQRLRGDERRAAERETVAAMEAAAKAAP